MGEIIEGNSEKVGTLRSSTPTQIHRNQPALILLFV